MSDHWKNKFRWWLRSVRHSRVVSRRWWISQIPFWLKPAFFWLLITFPLRWFFAAWHDRRLRNLLWGLPGIALLVFAGFCFDSLRSQWISIPNTYWDEADLAVKRKDYALGALLLDRVLQENRTHVYDARYGMAVIFQETGQTDRAEYLFSALAPDDRRVHKDAHRRLAILLSDSISQESGREELERFYWHLDAARDQNTPEMALAWGRYALAIGDLDGARRYLEIAVTTFPELHLTLGQIHTQLGNTQQALDEYDKARLYLSDRVLETPEERLSRVDYATVLMRLGRLEEARVVMEEGRRMDANGGWETMLAALFVNYHDLLLAEGDAPLSELFEPLAHALEHDPNYAPALNRLMAYATAEVRSNEELHSVLARVVAEGKQPALAHLALGNLCWLEGDSRTAMVHFERALRINEKLAVVMNNLAWILSHDPQKMDLDRALALVDTALKERPENPSFLDTRGTIYMLQGRDDDALDDFEMAIDGVLDPAAVHQKLAEIYERKGLAVMAEQHRLLEKEARDRARPSADGTQPLPNAEPE